MNVIRGRQHNLSTEQVNKIALSANDDKIIIQPGKIQTLAHGHRTGWHGEPTGEAWQSGRGAWVELGQTGDKGELIGGKGGTGTNWGRDRGTRKVCQNEQNLYLRKRLIYAIWCCEALGSLQIDITSPPPN